jgi:hypothetical protein
MFSNPDTIRVERCAANAQIRSVLRVLMIVVALVALGAPLMAQEAGGEANLKLPDLGTVTFLGGISGSNLLMGGRRRCKLTRYRLSFSASFYCLG